MSKVKAASIHFLFSLFFISSFVIWVYFIWYDQIFADLSGVFEPIKMLILVDVILGPLLTFIVYKESKKSLKFDISSIVFIQLLAFMYGAYTLFIGKPSLVVMNNKLMEVVIQKQLDSEQFSAEFSNDFNAFFKPVYAQIDPAKQNLFTAVRTQQNNLELIDFSAPEIQKKSLNLTHVLDKLALERMALESILNSNKLESFHYYPLIDNTKYAVLVVDDNDKPVKVMLASEAIINISPAN